MMARRMQMEQQVEEIAEGMFEWKVDRFLQRVTAHRRSAHFKVGRHMVYLNMSYNFSQHSLDRDVRPLRHMKINLWHLYLGGIFLFRKKTYFIGGLISRHGDVYSSVKGCINSAGNYVPVMSCSETFMSFLLQNSSELVPEDTLTFQLAWSDNIIRLDSMIRRRTSPDEVKVEIPRMSLEKLSKDFEDFFESKTNTDCVLMVGDEQFPVHRVVLSARSSVFAAMFRHDMLENRNGVVNISDVEAGIMSDVLHYIYTGQIRRLDAETAVKMYVVALRYALMEMKDNCLDFLMRNLTMENFVDAIELAHMHGLPALEQKVMQFIAENADKLQENIAWKEFSRTNPSQGLKYLESALIIKPHDMNHHIVA